MAKREPAGTVPPFLFCETYLVCQCPFCPFTMSTACPKLRPGPLAAQPPEFLRRIDIYFEDHYLHVHDTDEHASRG